MGLEEIVRDGMEIMESYASGGNPHRRNGRVRGWGGVGNLHLFGFVSCVVLH